MTQISAPALGAVQQTLLVPLYARAIERQQPTPIVHDRKASEILSNFDFDLKKFQPYRRTMLGCCVRANVFDGWIRDFLTAAEAPVVIEIGAGMDTTFERLDDGRVLWYEIDFPDVISVRRRFFQETERRRFLPGSVLEGNWIHEVQATGRESYLFQAAGVLTYFSEQEVRQLFTMVADSFPGALFLFDSCNRWTLRNAFRWEPALKFTNAKYRWGIDDPALIQEWDARFERLQTEHHVDQWASRWPLWIRIVKSLIPAVRRSFSLNMVRLG